VLRFLLRWPALRFSFFAFIIFVSSIFWIQCVQANSIVAYPGTVTSVARGNGASWDNPSYAMASDGYYASAFASYVVGTQYLRATNFDFSSLPANSQITGIKVEIQRRAGAGEYYVFDSDTLLVLSDSEIGSFKFGDGNPIPTSDATVVYGDEWDLWGTTLTAADVKDASFGVDVSFNQELPDHTYHAYVNFVRITVYYTPPPSVKVAVKDSDQFEYNSCTERWKLCGYGLVNAGEDIDVRITFSEEVTGFTSGDITVANGSVKSLSGSNAIYDATITVDVGCSSCVVTVNVPAEAATSVATSVKNAASNTEYIPAGSSYFQRCYYWQIWNCSWNWWDFWWRFYYWHRYRYWRWWWWWYDYYWWFNKGIYYPLNETQGSTAFNRWWRVGRWWYPYSYWWRNWSDYWSYQDAWLMNKSDFSAGSFTRSFNFETSGKKCPATTQAGNSYSLSFGGNDAIFTLNEYPFHFGYGWHYWPWYYYYDYPWYYWYWNNWQTYTLSFWAKSAVANPVDQTLFFAKSSNGDALRIAYRNDKTNYIHVATTNTALRSNTSFDLTLWHHIVVRFQYNEPTALYVDDSAVTTSDAGVLNGGDYPQSWPLIIGATSTGSSSIGRGFQGNLDEIKIFPGWTTIADGTVNNTCNEQSSSLYTITNFPSDDSSFSTVDYDDETDLHTTGKWAGKYYVLLQKSGVPIVNALTDLTQNRSWQGVTASLDAAHSKVAVYFDPNTIGTHGHDPATDKHMIFATKNNTASFRVCPDATSLNDLSDQCSNGVLFKGPFPQTQTVKSLSVEVGEMTINGASYWYASGLTGSGGQGEGSTALADVPYFSWWTLPVIVLLCGGYLYWGDDGVRFRKKV
jgi:hypothetical protein